MKLGPQGTAAGKEGDKTQENQTSSTHMGWIQHWKRESSSFKCIHDQTLLMVITVSHIERSLQPPGRLNYREEICYDIV